MEGKQGGGPGTWRADEFWDLVLCPPAIVTEASDPAVTHFPAQAPLAEVPERLVSLSEPIVSFDEENPKVEAAVEPEPTFGESGEWGEPNAPPPMDLALDLWMPSTVPEVSTIERPERSGFLPEITVNLEQSRWTTAAKRRAAVAGVVCGGLLLIAWAPWSGSGKGVQPANTAQRRPPVSAPDPIGLTTTTASTTTVAVVETVPEIAPTTVAFSTKTPVVATLRATSTSPARSAPATTPVPTTSSPPTTGSSPTTESVLPTTETTATVSTTTTVLNMSTTVLRTTTTSRGSLDGTPGAPGRSG